MYVYMYIRISIYTYACTYIYIHIQRRINENVDDQCPWMYAHDRMSMITRDSSCSGCTNGNVSWVPMWLRPKTEDRRELIF